MTSPLHRWRKASVFLALLGACSLEELPPNPPPTQGSDFDPGGSSGVDPGFGGFGGSNGNVTVPGCVLLVIGSRCTFGCHTAETAAVSGNLNLNGELLPTLLDQPASYAGVANPATCTPNAKLIDSTIPTESVLFRKISGSQSCGASMPFGAVLQPDELVCLESWILAFGMGNTGGAAGAGGSAGTSGGAGTAGSAGASGFSGMAGSAGAAGTSGSSGSAGASGSSGASGSAGSSGTTGMSGAAGSSGTAESSAGVAGTAP